MKLQHEIRHAAAGLKKVPIFVFTLVFTMALTLGALLAAFNLNQLILFKELPYANAEQLYILEQHAKPESNQLKGRQGIQHIGAQVRMHNSGKELFDTALVFRSRGILASVASEPRLETLYTTHEYFDLLTVPFTLGKGFTESSTLNEAIAEAVISYDTWQRYYAGDKNVIGQSLQFDHQQFTIVGVISPDVVTPKPFSSYPVPIYLPAAYAGLTEETTGGTGSLRSLVKLNQNQNPIQINQQLSAIYLDFMQTKDSANYEQTTQYNAHLISLSEAIKGDSGRITLIILAGALVLLLIAFANVINLYLSHINKKQQLLAICASVGATPKALFKRLFVESFLLTLSSAIFALVVASWLMVFIKALASQALPRLDELSLDITTVIFSLMLAVILAALLAFCGRFSVKHNALKEQLTASGKGTSAQVSPKVRFALIASQVSLTGILLLVTSIVLQSSLSVVNRPLGLNIENVISVEVDADKNYDTPEKRRVLINELKNHFNQLPQIDSASMSMASPIRTGHNGALLYDKNKKRLGGFLFNKIDENFLEQMQIPILYGRNFTEEETAENQKVILLSKEMAEFIFNKANAVGEHVYFRSGTALKVIGITDDYFSVSNKNEPVFYRTLDSSRINIMLKVKPNMTLSKVDVLAELRTIDTSLSIQEYLELKATAKELVYQYWLAACLAAGLTAFALILACAGIYGVVSYSTQMRRYELGVRMSLGAKRKRVINLVLKDALKPILAGLMVSLLLSGLIYGIALAQITQLPQPDILQTITSLVLLLLFSLLASFIPVNNIIKQDPIKALRNE